MLNWRSILKSLGIAVMAAILTSLGLQIVPLPAQPPVLLPSVPSPSTTPTPSAAPLDAICRLSFNGVGCSATVVGPRRVDGRYHVLTAAHCTQGIGQRGVILFRDSRKMSVEVKAIDRSSDCAWLVTESVGEVLPFALLSDVSPAPGTPIWHAGFGVDVPSNREDGVVLSGPTVERQLRMRLSVSSGDSGGGIALSSEGKIISCVCCTAMRGRMADVWGASPEAIRALLPVVTDQFDWTPLELPLKK